MFFNEFCVRDSVSDCIEQCAYVTIMYACVIGLVILPLVCSNVRCVYVR